MRGRGFTLIELLVVIAIMGIATGIVALSIAPSESRIEREEFTRLGALFHLARDEARVSGRRLVWKADLAGYRFLTADGEAAGKGPDDPLRPRRWPFEVRRVDAAPIVFGREPLLEPETLTVATAERELRYRLDPFGDLTQME